jgi:hypothetical protein
MSKFSEIENAALGHLVGLLPVSVNVRLLPSVAQRQGVTGDASKPQVVIMWGSEVASEVNPPKGNPRQFVNTLVVEVRDGDRERLMGSLEAVRAMNNKSAGPGTFKYVQCSMDGRNIDAGYWSASVQFDIVTLEY